MSKGNLLIITGISGSGKTHLANDFIINELRLKNEIDYPNEIAIRDPEYIEFLQNELSNSSLSVCYARKYSSREARREDVGMIHCSSNEVRQNCDIVYGSYNNGTLFGFNSKEMLDQIDLGKTLVIVTGFMEMVQLIMRRFYELGRIDDVFVFGITGILPSLDCFMKLEKSRYGSDIDEQILHESANKRFLQSQFYARQFEMFSDTLLFDDIFPNTRLKYLTEPDIHAFVLDISNTLFRYNKDGLRWKNAKIVDEEERKQAIESFINADLALVGERKSKT